MYSPYSFNYNITSIFCYKHIDNSLYQKEWDVNVPLPWFHRFYSFPVVCHMLNRIIINTETRCFYAARSIYQLSPKLIC